MDSFLRKIDKSSFVYSRELFLQTFGDCDKKGVYLTIAIKKGIIEFNKK